MTHYDEMGQFDDVTHFEGDMTRLEGDMTHHDDMTHLVWWIPGPVQGTSK